MSSEIVLTQGKVAIVDDADFEYLNQWKWFFQNRHNRDSGSAARLIADPSSRRRQKTIYMSRVILNAPDDMFVDHISGDPLDNRRVNLRLATPSQNARNRKIQKNETSQFKGVSYHIRDKRWQANIGCNGKFFYLGSFEDEIEAAEAYNQAALLYFGEFARLNDISAFQPSSKTIVWRKQPTSNYPGVYRKGKKWASQIGSGNTRKHLGTFTTEQEAIDARKKVEKERQ